MGRKLKYSLDEFESRSREYLSSIRYTRALTDESGEEIKNELGHTYLAQVWIEPPTTAGWALYLGISKSTLTTHYRARYPEAYERIKTVLEAYNTRELLTRKTGAEAVKFNLQNNYGWRDTRVVEEGSMGQAASEQPLSLGEKLERLRRLVDEYGKSIEDTRS